MRTGRLAKSAEERHSLFHDKEVIDEGLFAIILKIKYIDCRCN